MTGIEEKDLYFVMVPANIPGPADKGFDKTTFEYSIVGFGDLYDGAVYASCAGTAAALKDPGVKLYQVAYDGTTTEGFVDFEKYIHIPGSRSTKPNTVVAACPAKWKTMISSVLTRLLLSLAPQ